MDISGFVSAFYFFCQLWVITMYICYSPFTRRSEKDGTVGYCKAWKSHAEDGPSDDEVAERLWRREVEVKTSGGCAAAGAGSRAQALDPVIHTPEE